MSLIIYSVSIELLAPSVYRYESVLVLVVNGQIAI